MQSQILIITSQCSAGCHHCPYGRANGQKISIPIIEENTAPVIVTGGEPFETLDLWHFIERLEEIGTMYRIATGGHVPLTPFLTRLRKAFLLSGIQLGTDVLLSSRSDGRHRAQWLANARALGIFNIPYSITFTPAVENDVKEIIAYLRFTRPSFIHLNIEMIKEDPNALLIFDGLKHRLSQTGVEIRHDPV